jgi:hypothetical protein
MHHSLGRYKRLPRGTGRAFSRLKQRMAQAEAQGRPTPQTHRIVSQLARFRINMPAGAKQQSASNAGVAAASAARDWGLPSRL